MADAVSIPVSGFNVPPMSGPGAQGAGVNNRPHNPAVPAPDYQSVAAPVVQTAGPTEADIQARIDAAVAASKAPQGQAPVTAPLVVPAAVSSADVKPGIADPLLGSLHGSMSALAPALDVHRAIGAALASGDISRIDKAYIAEAGGAHAAHLQAVAEQMVSHVQRQAADATTKAHAAAGGQPQWLAATAAFNTQAPTHIRALVSSMLDSGNPESIGHAISTIVDYAKNSGLVAVPGKMVGAGASNLSADQALSKAEFQALNFKLDKNSPTFQAQRAELFNRRSLGAQLGK